MDLQTLLFTQKEDVATVTINRPDKLNSLNAAVFRELDGVLSIVATEEGIRGLIITGAGDKSFVAGADIKQFTGLDAVSGRAFARTGQILFDRIERLPKPVIAAVNGYALGGGFELALACHLRVASENAQFGLPEVTLGLLPGYGGTQRLPRVVGRGIATEIVLTGDRITAQRAYEIGLVNRITPPGGALDGAMALMQTILSRAPRAVALALEALAAADGPLDRGQLFEASLFGQACATEDFREGVTAFLERRPAQFTGK